MCGFEWGPSVEKRAGLANHGNQDRIPVCAASHITLTTHAAGPIPAQVLLQPAVQRAADRDGAPDAAVRLGAAVRAHRRRGRVLAVPAVLRDVAGHVVDERAGSQDGPPLPHRRHPQRRLGRALGDVQQPRLLRPRARVVEAISGNAVSSLSPATLEKYGLRDPGPGRSSGSGSGGGQEGTFSSLVTRWTVRPLERKTTTGEEWSQVDLSIKFQFVNPLFAAVSSAVADKVAPIMVEAFEKEARRALGRTPGRQ
ncbi:hypothetical protein G7054_g14868 [Neopestalotiopsis clavispora]|nr:hypothetical protein G7054_g14868 [Neopestalotiopsis clavispora]